MSEVKTLPVLPSDVAPRDLVTALRDAGCAVVERLAPAALMETIGAELEPYLHATPFGVDSIAGHRTRRTGALIARSPAFRELAAHPLVLAVLDRVLGDHATRYQLHLTQAIDVGPGERPQKVHRDQWAFDHFPFPAGFEAECLVMWALTDFTEENGATRVVPGSHRWEDRLVPTQDETVPALMARGSALVYLGSLYHGGGANCSPSSRLGLNVGYTLGWLRQEENQYLACPPDVARELPVELAKLIGYRRGSYSLGYFGDVQEPMEVLHPDQTSAPGFSTRP
jgi:ectoine hydroxylase-related dioxygenase (phytanoyl-CoA dioxygenase family)